MLRMSPFLPLPVLFFPLLSFTKSLSSSLLFLFFCAFLSFTYSMFPSLLLHVLPCPRPSLPTCLLRYFAPSFSAPSLPSLMPYFVSYFLLTCLSPSSFQLLSVHLCFLSCPLLPKLLDSFPISSFPSLPLFSSFLVSLFLLFSNCHLPHFFLPFTT